MQVVEGSQDCTPAKRLWHIVRALYYMLQKGITKRRMVIDLNLLFKRGKLAGKAIGNLMFHHHHHHHGDRRPAKSSHHHRSGSGGSSQSALFNALSCRAVEPGVSYYNPREVEFSCSSTPAYQMPSFLAKHASKRRRRRDEDSRAAAAADAVRMAFDILASEIPDSPLSSSDDSETPLGASPSSQLLFWDYGRSPAPVRQLRISDSPFLALEDDQDDEGRRRVNQEAEEFISRFYQQLRSQRMGEL